MRTIRFCRSLQISASILSFLLTFLIISGSGGQTGTVSAQTTRTITALLPTTVTVGDPSFTLQVTGTNFVQGDTVLLSGSPLDTDFVSATLLTAFVPANALTQAVFLQVQVLPAGTLQAQGAADLFIETPSTKISIASISPANVTQNQTGVSLVITGTGLSSNSKVLISGQSLTPTTGTANGSTTLTVSLTTAETAVKGFIPVQITDSTQTAATDQLSNLQTLNVDVTNTTPVITSINPTTVGAGTDDFNLTIVGTDFVPGAQVSFGGTNVAITSFSETLITVIVPASLIRAAGSFPVIVTNPGGVASTDGTQFVVTAPVYLIQNISPLEVIQGGPTVDVQIFGDNIPTNNTVTVTLNGAALPTGVSIKTVTQDAITIEILNTSAVLATPGTLTFEITNPADTNPPVDRTMKVDAANLTVSTFAGDPANRFVGLVDGPLATARFSRPSRMVESPVDHSLWIADQLNNAVRRIAMDPADPNFGLVQTIAGGGNTHRGLNCVEATTTNPVNPTGTGPSGSTCKNSFTVTPGVAGTVDPTTNPVVMNNPVAVVIDANNVVYVSEGGQGIIRRITPQGPVDDRSYVVDILAGDFTDIPDATTGVVTRTPVTGFADGPATPATPTDATSPSAVFNGPDGLALGVDVNGNHVLYVNDSQNFKVRRIFLDGPNANTVDTIAGTFFGDADGDRFSASLGSITGSELEVDGISIIVCDPQNRSVRVVNALTGFVSTIGLPGTANTDGGTGAGGFSAPSGTATTLDGKLLVADAGNPNSGINNNAIRWLQPDGAVVTIAGTNSTTGGFADGAQFTALFNDPRSVFVASDGTIYVVDTGNNLIRKITPTQTTQPPPLPGVRRLQRPITQPSKTVRPIKRGN